MALQMFRPINPISPTNMTNGLELLSLQSQISKSQRSPTCARGPNVKYPFGALAERHKIFEKLEARKKFFRMEGGKNRGFGKKIKNAILSPFTD